MMRFILQLTDYLLNLCKSHDLIFDLDNTIYDENSFLEQSYRNISNEINCISGHLENEMFDYLWSEYLIKGRDELFDKFIKEFSLTKLADTELILSIMRSKGSKLIMFNYFAEFLSEISNLGKYKFFIITNGNKQQQSSKISHLGLFNNHLLKEVVYSSDFQPKPSPDSFIFLDNQYDLKNPIYIGDSEIDKEFSINAKINFARILFKRNDSGFIDESSIKIEGAS